jgi:putative pyruvate formate lyase activating enzyme
MEVASVCVHRGEEPPLNPIVNVFFAHCNLQCTYCQNWQISKVEDGKWNEESVEGLAERICALLPKEDGMLGLVTAAHYADRIPELLDAVHRRGFFPVVVYNSGGYESVETLRKLEGLVDVYLPDFKYMDAALAQAYSHAADYPEAAQAAIREMRRQVGGGLKVDDNGRAYRGLIVRHLVLPGAVDNSLRCLEWLADEFPLGLHLSLMAQYYPPRPGLPAPLDRTLTAEEYALVTTRAEALGLTDGWVQELEASDNYRPDFESQTPFNARV